jgi:hypothetical protein
MHILEMIALLYIAVNALNGLEHHIFRKRG